MKYGFIPLVLVLSFGLIATAYSEPPKGALPVLTTSAGQSADVNTLNVTMEEAEIAYDYCDVPSVAMLKTGVGLGGRKSGKGFHVETHTDLSVYPKGTAYKTVIVAIGASLKGMGASGLTVEDETKRLAEIIQYCKANEITVIAVHAGGTSKRGAPGSANEKMIDAVAPLADYIIATKDSNKDGRFTTIAKDKGIALTEIEYALDLVEIFADLFN